MINKVEMKKILKKELQHRKQELNDDQIDAVIDEAQTMSNQVAPFMSGKSLEQIIAPAFIAGVQFALDDCVQKTETLDMSTKDGGKNWDRNYKE